jgi:predicted ATPase with chaperone activity
LDALPEFKRHVLEVLRQLLEDGSQISSVSDILDLTALATLAARMQIATDS